MIKKDRQPNETEQQYKCRIGVLQTYFVNKFANRWGNYILYYLRNNCNLSYDCACDIRQELYIWFWQTNYIDLDAKDRAIKCIIRTKCHQLISRYKHFDHDIIKPQINVRPADDIQSHGKRYNHINSDEESRFREIISVNIEEWAALQRIIDIEDIQAALEYADKHAWTRNISIGDLLRLSVNMTPMEIANTFNVDVQSVKQSLSRWRKRLQKMYR